MAEHPLADLEPLGLVQRTPHGWQLTEPDQRRYGPALSALDGFCRELEEAGCPWREWALTLIAAGERALRDAA